MCRNICRHKVFFANCFHNLVQIHSIEARVLIRYVCLVCRYMNNLDKLLCFSPINSSGRSVQFGNGIPYSLALVHSSSHSTGLILSHSSLEAKYGRPSWHSSQEGNSSDRQANSELVGSALIQASLQKVICASVTGFHSYYSYDSQRKWRNWAASLSVSSWDRSIKATSKNTCLAPPPTAHSCHALSCSLQMLPV